MRVGCSAPGWAPGDRPADTLPRVDTSERAERRFYLEHFRQRSLVVAGGGDDPSVPAALGTLVEGGARVVHVHGDDVTTRRTDDDFVGECWAALRRHGRVSVPVPRDEDVLEVATELAGRLRPFKLVLLDPDAPAHGDRPPPFVVLRDREGDGPSIELARTALAAGVGSVNVCRPTDLAEELLTYHGAGVLYTSEQYCHVEPLRLDDYEGAHRLIEQGVAEGFLLPRSAGATARLLLNGYGARFGDDHLAGFAALRPYPDDRTAEVSCLTTISRFGGGGVGGMIVRRMLDDAAADGLDAVFACTTSPDAIGFFRALGFVEVPVDALPATKWDGYDPARRRRLVALRHDLTGRAQP